MKRPSWARLIRYVADDAHKSKSRIRDVVTRRRCAGLAAGRLDRRDGAPTRRCDRGSRAAARSRELAPSRLFERHHLQAGAERASRLRR
jgi:hypothetical protein